MARWFNPKARRHRRRDELLSAYLDGQLSSRERTRLEARLETDEALRSELEALRRTVGWVRDLPRAPLPRNFILSPADAERARPTSSVRPRLARAAPWLTGATALAGLLFAVLLVADLFVGGSRLALLPAPDLQVEKAAEQPAAEVAELAPAPSPFDEGEAEESLAGEGSASPSPPPPAWEAPMEEPALEAVPEVTAPVGASGPSEEFAAPSPTDAPQRLAAPTASPEAADGVAAGDEEHQEATAVGTEAGEADKPAPPTSPAALRAAEGEATLSPTPAEAGRADPLPDEDGGIGAPGALEKPPRAPVQVPWRLILEVALGVAVVSLALASVWAWRARRRPED